MENIEPNDSDDEYIAAAEEAIIDDQVEHDDDGQIEHDWEAVKSSRDKAIQDMGAFYNVRMTPEEKKMALKIFPAVYFLFSNAVSKSLIYILSRWLAWLDGFMMPQFSIRILWTELQIAKIQRLQTVDTL